MNLDERDLFTELEPPPGGVERFRRRLEENGEPAPVRQRAFAIAGLVASVIALSLIVAVTRHGEAPEPRVARLHEAPEFDRLLGRPMDRAAFSVSINGESPSVTEIPSTHAKIRIYEVEID